MKLNVVTTTQSTSVNLNCLQNHAQMNMKNTLRYTVGKEIATLAKIKRKLLIGKTG